MSPTIVAMRYAKGHGTGNDFVILPDLDDRLQLSAELARQLCDRHTGIGADGVLRVVADWASGSDRTWFMDYRNADGGVAEMCGNGIRVFARYLIDRGLAAGPEVAIGTRAGVRTVRREADGQFSVDMGSAVITGKGSAEIAGHGYPGLAIDVGNPHLACVVSQPVTGFDLSVPPAVDGAEFPNGVNVEVVRLTGDRSVEMRVHERGSGETRSCGTGAVAAAVAAAAATGRWPGSGSDRWLVAVPGGTLTVTPSEVASVLTGPAVLVAEGETEPGWLEHG
jgi:diaminopimelate epimerase